MSIQVFKDIGKRKYMEDYYNVISFEDLILVTVCDGHGGHHCSEFVSKEFPARVKELFMLNKLARKSFLLKRAVKDIILKWDHKCFGSKMFSTLKKRDNFFSNIDKEKYNRNGLDSGTTLSACLIDKKAKKIYTVNIGDSRITCNIDDNLIQTLDHETKQKLPTKFKNWIEDGRINGELAVGASIGDNSATLSGCVSRICDSTILKYIPLKTQIIVASDGFYDEYKASESFKKKFNNWITGKTYDNITIVYIIL
jgi:serine/threonine protein phosphatase PrpC